MSSISGESSSGLLVDMLSRRSSPAFLCGLYKLENLVALGTSLLILLAGYEILREVLSNTQPPLVDISLAVPGIILTIIIT